MTNVNIVAMTVNNISQGTDIVDVERIDRLIQKYGDIFLSRIFDPMEITYCQQTAKPANSFAARFAAKEAFAKAFGTGMAQILGGRISPLGRNLPENRTLYLSENGKDKIKNLGLSAMKVSISHTKTLAQAVVIFIK
jgi:holo-[acyl-carrier protein] synthase